MGITSSLFPVTQPKTKQPTAPQQYLQPGGDYGPYDPSNNYGNSGMSYADYSKKYGTPQQQESAASAAGAAAGRAGTAQVNNPSVNPNLSPATPAPQSSPTYGTESGPGIMQQWFNERATGTDPAFEYASKRGLTDLDNAYAARGAYNSGAATRGASDFMANLVSQREGQLDQLASGASGERQNQLSTMLGFGNGIAGAGAGLAGQYDLGAANALNSANASGLQLATNAAMIPYMANQGLMQNMFGLGALGLAAL